MKKLIVLCCLLMVSFLGFSQSNAKLQGPKAKNTKPWHKKDKKPQLVVVQNRKVLKGPIAKNAKPWQKTDQVQPVQSLATTRLKLQGPKAKNYKVWQNKRTDAADKWTVIKSPKQKVVSD